MFVKDLKKGTEQKFTAPQSWAPQQLPTGWVTQPEIKGTRVVLKIEL